MDYTFVIFSILIVIFMVVLYYYFSSTTTVLYGNQVLLNGGTPNHMLAGITTSPTSLNYTLSLWVFLVGWSSNDEYNVILNMNTTSHAGGSTATSRLGTNGKGALSNYVLYLDKSSPSLYWYVPSTGGGGSTPVSGDVLVTNSFPVQSWVFIAISMQGTLGDL